MKNSKKIHEDGKGIKTFFTYLIVVFLIIFIALSVKAFFVIKQSKYDGKSLVIAISRNHKIRSVVGFNAISNSYSVLKISNDSISSVDVSRMLGVIKDAEIDSKSNLSYDDPQVLITSLLLRSKPMKTNLTPYDILQLLLLSKSLQGKPIKIETVKLPSDEGVIDKIVSELFANDIFYHENISVEIRNASELPGLGKRLERGIVNLGGNVVAVSTPRVSVRSSKIQYSGKTTYMLSKLKRILNLPVEQVKDKSLADIIIIIGKDQANTGTF